MIEGVVRTAYKLTPEEKLALEKCMSDLLGAKVGLTEKVDESLIAGICVEIAGRVLDNSVKERLMKVRRELMKRGSIHNA